MFSVVIIAFGLPKEFLEKFALIRFLHLFFAITDDIADLTPNLRASYEAAATTPLLLSPPTAIALPFKFESSNITYVVPQNYEIINND